MTVYLDSSALIKLYVIEENSERVERFVTQLKAPLPLSALHEIEMRNGLRLKAFRREASRRAVGAALQHLADDFASGVLYRPSLDWPDVFNVAESLSKRHAAILGCRSLDLLHVASANILRTNGFLTFDQRQAALAHKAGLRVLTV